MMTNLPSTVNSAVLTSIPELKDAPVHDPLGLTNFLARNLFDDGSVYGDRKLEIMEMCCQPATEKAIAKALATLRATTNGNNRTGDELNLHLMSYVAELKRWPADAVMRCLDPVLSGYRFFPSLSEIVDNLVEICDLRIGAWAAQAQILQETPVRHRALDLRKIRRQKESERVSQRTDGL